jgi:hypothetical protein
MSSFSQLLTRRRDASAAHVALPKIAHDLGSFGLGDLSWVLNAYAI